MRASNPQFEVQLAHSADDLHAVQRLRYDVFVTELGADGPLVDHVAKTEVDAFDAFSDHLILRDRNRPSDDQVVGVYRIMNSGQATGGKGYSCAKEYDLSALTGSGKTLLELGRSCLHADYRGGTAMFEMWRALAKHIRSERIDVLFGVASFHGAKPNLHCDALNMLMKEHMSPLFVPSHQPAEIQSPSYDKKVALRQTPALIKAYLRLGGTVGQGAFVDRDFNTTDVCMILDVNQISARQMAIYLT